MGPGAHEAMELVYGNKVVFGSVNAARRHYDQAADAPAQADPGCSGNSRRAV
jgi:hypothetical protein